jgi:hypothetical protein
MKCSECSGEYKITRDALEINDDYIGKFLTDIIDYYKCTSCNDTLLPSKSAKSIEEKRKKILNDILQSFPIKDFVSSTEASDILNISRQALHKHRRIRNGLIFNTSFGGKTVYLRESVLLYKQKEDGRFPLVLNIIGVNIANIHYMPMQRNTLESVYTDPNNIIPINRSITSNLNSTLSTEIFKGLQTYTPIERIKESCIMETGGKYGRS